MTAAPPALSDSDFERFRELIHRIAGISLGEGKRTLVEGRLGRRLRATGMATHADYYARVTRPDDNGELQHLVDVLTTNQTYFFREPAHFDVLARIAGAWPKDRPFNVWSAAASTGEEIYSIALVLLDQLGATRPWSVLGTDISSQVLATARAGRYDDSRWDDLPVRMRRHVRRSDGHLEFADPIRLRVRFDYLNLNRDLPPAWPRVPLIFVRNVMIYFDPSTKRSVVARLLNRLEPGGHLICGMAETLHGLSDRVELVAPSVYRLVR